MQKTKAEKKRDIILSGNLFKTILILAIPIIINNFIQTMYNLTDTYWLGQLGNPDITASITLVSPVQTIVVNFGQGLSIAGSVLIAQYIGRNNMKEAREMAHQLFLCSMIFSTVCAVICFLLTPSIVSWLGSGSAGEFRQTDVYSFSRIYLQIVILDMPFLFMINLYTAINQAQGNTLSPMYLNFAGIILNMIFDPLFLIVFKWGVAGAALATLISKIPCAIFALIAISNKNKDIFISFKNLRPNKEKLMKIFRIGLPTAIGGSTMQFGFLLMSKNVLKYGVLSVAAYGIANRINSIISMPANALGSATSTIVGQNIGAGQMKRAENAYKTARNMGVILLFALGLILSRNVVATALVRIFLQTPIDATPAQIMDIEKTVALCAEFLSLMALWCWTNSVYHTTNALFQASGHTLVTMLVDASRLWVFRFVTLYICENWLDMGVQSIWYSVVISNGLSAFILWILYLSGLWKRDVLNITPSKRDVT